MATNFFFHNVTIENFRTFKKLSIGKFKRFNIIGGFNGNGKTSLLESLFFCLDRRNPAGLIRPLLVRQVVSQTGPTEITSLFNDLGASGKGMLRFRTRAGDQTIRLTYGEVPPHVSVSLPSEVTTQAAAGRLSGGSRPSLVGINIETIPPGSDNVSEGAFVMPANNGVLATFYKTSNEVIPTGQFVSVFNPAAPQEKARLLSAVIKDRKLSGVIEIMRILSPSLQSLLILQIGEIPTIHGQFENGDMLPIALLGDGFQSLLASVIAVITCAGGVVMFDEIDATMHYSVVRQVWCQIAKLASDLNCQIFATSHSRECILSAAEGIRNAGKSQDFQYLRLERRDREHITTPYMMKDLENAEEFEVEIR